MSMIFTVSSTGIDGKSDRVVSEDKSNVHAAVYIWSKTNYKETFICGDFTIEELEEILNKIKELQAS